MASIKEHYKVAILTDHMGHNEENSMYSLALALHNHLKSKSIAIISRSVLANSNFFNQQNSQTLQAVMVDNEFSFETRNTYFDKRLVPVEWDSFDAIFLRIPLPFTENFLLYLSEKGKGKVMINDPVGILETSTKKFLYELRDYCPPLKLCRNLEDIISFSKNFPIVLKPLRGYGGAGIIKIDGAKLEIQSTIHNTLDYLTSIKEYIEEHGFLAMKFLKNVTDGDKRILVVNGEIMAASLRMPAKNSWLCNVSQGGSSVATAVTPEEETLIENLNTHLLKRGIFIYGADTLTDDDGKRVLSEVNTTSIGGFPQSEIQTGRPVLKLTANHIFKKIEAFYAN